MLNRMLAIILLAGALVQCTPHHTPAPLQSGNRGKPVGPKGNALSPFTYLRKISLHVRGQTPDRSEYEALARAIEKGEPREFLRSKLDSYLASDQHIDKMTFRLEELLALSASGVAYYSPHAANAENIVVNGPPSSVLDFPIHNSLNELVREVVSRNLTWDTLLTGKRYTAFPVKGESMSFRVSDLRFFAPAAGTPAISDKPVTVRFADDDPRVAGILTTSRFFGRYVNTAINKNRRRAAAVFRTFLCDDIPAIVVSEKANESAILDKVFPGHPGNDGSKAPTDIHGSNPDCMKCHYKLDPMGKTFQDSGMVLAPLASPGALVYTTTSGQKVDIPVAGIGELAQAIVNQDDYVRCQVKNFWRWFVGEDKPLNENLLHELTAKFNDVRRKPNDFIAYLAERPEFGFTNVSGSNGALVAEVKGILRNCIGCHDNEGDIPRFTEWPIGGDQTKHTQWLGRIRRSLSLDGSNKPRSMPPAKSVWQPSANQLATIQEWLDLGAPNE